MKVEAAFRMGLDLPQVRILNLTERHPSLRPFLLRPHSTMFPSELKLYMYFGTTMRNRAMPMLEVRSERFCQVSEFGNGALGWVLSIGELPINSARLLNVTGWSSFAFDDREELDLTRAPTLSNVGKFMLDFRPEESIRLESGVGDAQWEEYIKCDGSTCEVISNIAHPEMIKAVNEGVVRIPYRGLGPLQPLQSARRESNSRVQWYKSR